MIDNKSVPETIQYFIQNNSLNGGLNTAVTIWKLPLKFMKLMVRFNVKYRDFFSDIGIKQYHGSYML